MDTRRNFLKKASLGAAGMGLATSGFTTKNDTSKNFDNVGIITNTVRNEMKEDYKKAIRNLADIGYKCVEGGVPDGTASEYKKLLKNFGLRSVATGSSMSGLKEGLDKYFKTAEDLGAEYVICYYPWLSSAENLKIDEVMQASENINEVGKKVKEAGFRFAWHNHDKEFVDVDGKMAFDIIMENTDPEYATVELDWYWVVKGGQDPVDYFNKYPGRFEIGHVKDMNNNRDGGITCVGNGIMDFKKIIDHADTGGVKYYIVENERAVKGMKCARESYNHLAGIFHEM